MAIAGDAIAAGPAAACGPTGTPLQNATQSVNCPPRAATYQTHPRSNKRDDASRRKMRVGAEVRRPDLSRIDRSINLAVH